VSGCWTAPRRPSSLRRRSSIGSSRPNPRPAPHRGTRNRPAATPPTATRRTGEAARHRRVTARPSGTRGARPRMCTAVCATTPDGVRFARLDADSHLASPKASCTASATSPLGERVPVALRGTARHPNRCGAGSVISTHVTALAGAWAPAHLPMTPDRHRPCHCESRAACPLSDAQAGHRG
jgi:hypothetical protein